MTFGYQLFLVVAQSGALPALLMALVSPPWLPHRVVRL